jgi:hypothetical protein
MRIFVHMLEKPVLLGRCRALYDFSASKPQQLSFVEGDVIEITDKMEMWWKGRLQDRVSEC